MIEDVAKFLPLLLEGLRTTCLVTVLGIGLAIATAVPAGLARKSNNFIARLISGCFIEFFRGTSALVQLYWIFFALPLVGISFSPLAAGVIALGLNVGAYGAEIVRSGLSNVPVGQREAAISLNLSARDRLVLIIMPQALPIMIRPFNNLFIQLLKGTSLVSLVTLADITYQAKLIRTDTGQSALVFGLALIIYFALSWLITLGMTRIGDLVDYRKRAARSST